MPLALADKTIVVTRSEAQSDFLMQEIRTAGGEALLLPLLYIYPLEDQKPLKILAENLKTYAMAVFVSSNAVEYALPSLFSVHSTGWPQSVKVAAIGPGTAKTLAKHGIEQCLLPASARRFDSEALLELPEFSEACVRGQRVALLRGENGRAHLEQTLRARGAEVECVPCYRRQPRVADWDSLYQLWDRAEQSQADQSRVDQIQLAILISSSEALRYFIASMQESTGKKRFLQLLQTPVFTGHQRIFETAKNLGLKRVVLTNATDSGLIEGLCAYNWS